MFSGRMSRGEFAGAAAARFGIFASGVLAIPALLYALDQSQYCPPEMCGPRAASLITFGIMPLLYIGLMVSLIGIVVRRLRDIGVPTALAAVIPLLMLGDVLAALTLDGFVFSSYMRHAVHPIPGNLVMALACIAFLCVARGGDETGDAFSRRWGTLGVITLGVVTVVSVVALMKFLSEITMAFSGVVRADAVVYAMLYASALITPIIVIALLGAVAFRDRLFQSA
jgi:uncharacterized membrane protein YhaH (DUF805 family)